MTPTHYLPISKINTVVFCPRRYFIEAILLENKTNHHMTEGSSLHERSKREGEGVTVWSDRLGIMGVIDQVKQDHNSWLITEFKKGYLGEHESDQVQLCALALCFEEMRHVSLEYGFIFYFRTRQRLEVAFTAELRARVEEAVVQMRELAENSTYPPVISNRNKCRGCSVKDMCQPELKPTPWTVNFGEHL
jgi:CRISPR-associated exonuclease Cas4